jgi:CubicO group peptidase (beta-lactamase class C family)
MQVYHQSAFLFPTRHIGSLVKYGALMMLSMGILFAAQAQIKTWNGRQISAAGMDKFLQDQVDSLQLPALSIAFISDGKVVYHRALGIARLGTPQKVNDQSLFEAASLSKPVFAFWVLQMVDRGILNLDKPLYQYLPFPEIAHDDRYKRITARMVLDHTTGFPNWRWYDELDTTRHIKRGDMYLANPPGTFGYSGEGYHYLAKVVAHLRGRTLNNLDRLFQLEAAKTLRFKHSYYTWNNTIALRKVTGHQGGKIFGKAWPSAPPDEDSTYFGSASTLHTEAVDYAHFLIAVMNNKGLKKATIEDMLQLQSHVPKGDEANWGTIKGWSLGFAVEPTDHGTRYSHGGDNGGFQAGCMFYREPKIGYVYFTNCDKGGWFYEKLRIFLDELKPPDGKP